MDKRSILRAIGRGRAGHPAMFAGRFALDQLVAEGGTGSVWKARDGARGTPVALKFFSPSLCSIAVLEARRHLTAALHQCRHPAVVAPEEIVVSGECAAVVMPWVDGRSLARIGWGARGAHAIDDIGAWFAALLGALEDVHARGLVHGALHAGVIFPQGDEVRVVGWELNAWLRRLTAQARRRGLRLAGKECMSPAVREGQPPSPTDDIYAVGAILHRLLTGSAPAPREVDDDPVPVARHRAEIEMRGQGRAELWEQAAQRCMQPLAADRFASVRALRLWLGLEDLSHILSGAPIDASSKAGERDARIDKVVTDANPVARDDSEPALEPAALAGSRASPRETTAPKEPGIVVSPGGAEQTSLARDAHVAPEPHTEPAHITIVRGSDESVSVAVAGTAAALVNDVTETGPAERELVFWPPPEVQRDEVPRVPALEPAGPSRRVQAPVAAALKPEGASTRPASTPTPRVRGPERPARVSPSWRCDVDDPEDAAPASAPAPATLPRKKVRGVLMLRTMLSTVTVLTVAAGGWLVWQIVEQRYPEFADSTSAAVRSAGAALMERIERYLPDDRPFRTSPSPGTAVAEPDRAVPPDGFLYGHSAAGSESIRESVGDDGAAGGGQGVRVQQELFLVPARGPTHERGVFDLSHVDAPPRPVSIDGPLVPSDVLARTVPGHVELVLVIDRTGQVISVDAQSATDDALVGPSMEAARQWRFAPATRGGRAVAVRAAVPLAFNTP